MVFPEPDKIPLDDNLTKIMDVALEMSKVLRPDVPEEILKAKITASNLKALVNTLLIADEKPEEIAVDLKQVALGLLATADWIDPEGSDDWSSFFPDELTY